jgi:hypothetical protein
LFFSWVCEKGGGGGSLREEKNEVGLKKVRSEGGFEDFKE